MKIWLSLSLMLAGLCCLNAEKMVDPFSEHAANNPVEKEEDEGPSAVLSDDLLKAFDEKSLDQGTGKKDMGVIRITILRSFKKSLMFSWYPSENGKEGILVVKRIPYRYDPDKGHIYGELDLNKRIQLSEAHEMLLKTLNTKADIFEMPKHDWQEGVLDGSLWIYESASDQKRGFVLSRRSPFDPVLEAGVISKERLLQETRLNAFALVMWTIAGLNEELY